ncbi:DUF6310 domain-containing protein [Corallococcus sp. AS-1-6]|uniref:DUF6310 domain-containing protein n=1 Tax=Corallococcus sp. AS-1-6 TaxID=2874599 RepID=UPI001CBB80B0|nr:DUF6310 domain-containing protein [Corallococcus sp. AS-1-6]MBZ4370125.1 DUF6310 domain-containing protein [Corallococcus sp. AS-1-6]
MHRYAGILLGVLLSACATTPAPAAVARAPGLSTLQRAAKLPWTDEGRCVVREATRPWPTVVEHCFQQLDHDRIRFHDTTGRCTAASAGAATLGLGVCILAAPEIAVGAVIIIGVVVVAAAIHEALDAYELRQLYPEETRSVSETQTAIRSSLPKRKPQPQPSGQDWFPPVPGAPSEHERNPNCSPKRVPHLGGNDLHNKCADRIPRNTFSGWDALVDGKNFDGLQGATRMLWEVKTNDIETYSPFVRQAELQKQVDEAKRERALAEACGFQFSIGVRTEAHKKLLEALLPDFNIVLMTWC